MGFPMLLGCRAAGQQYLPKPEGLNLLRWALPQSISNGKGSAYHFVNIAFLPSLPSSVGKLS